MSDSEHDESSLSPELAKSLRKLCRSKFTKLCTAIEAGIAASKNIAVLEEQKATLTELYEECMRLHSKYSAAIIAGPDGPDKERAENWATALHDSYKKIFGEIDSYVKMKIAETTLAAQQLLEIQAANTTQQLLNAQKALSEAQTATAAQKQKEALKRRYEMEDEEIAKKRLAEDEARAAERDRLNQKPREKDTPRTSTPNKDLGKKTTDQPDLSFIENEISTCRKYNNTGRQDASAIPNAVDAWIFLPFQPVTPLSGGADAMVTMAMLAKMKPFGGEPRDWPVFIQTVKSMVHDVFPADIQRLTMLSTMLSPHLKEGMSQIFVTPQAYRAALIELHRKYGHPHLVVRSYIQHLMAIQLCRGGKELETFSSQLHGAVATLDAAGYGHELESSVALEGLVTKLPDSLLSRWGRQVTRLFPRIPTLRDLDAWLELELMGMKNVQSARPTAPEAPAINTPSQYSNRYQQERVTYGNRQGNQTSHRANTQQNHAALLPTVNAINADQSYTSKCKVCNEEPGHALDRCTRFIEMTVDQRAQIVWDLENCFRCLGRNHLCRDCKKENLRCTVPNCNSSAHHTMIHDAARISTQSNRTNMGGRSRRPQKQ
ncbi:uncharacterized protein LOC116935425 [Daphnia magna]|uniref:uncharacterized protein LOC116935425 n=1 Tax=Daphnia magna TaxID=35525 RepID=UPI001E1BA8E0|nr:uncharacterized protein LOC116935425 [Daphnia magna]